MQVPDQMGLQGWRHSRTTMSLDPAGKPPKLRFQPGMFVQLDGQLYEILYAYRVRANSQEWQYCLEERRGLSSAPRDAIGAALVALGCGERTPRIVYEVFRDGYDAMQFFADIPADADRMHASNKTLLQRGKVVSSGEVLSKESP
jgi:hypothetical protein